MFWKNTNPYDSETNKNGVKAFYSVLIHFTPIRPYVYVLKNDTFISDEGGVISFTDSDRGEIEITGTCVCKNDFDSLGDVEIFIQRYKLDDPILIEVDNVSKHK